jgi:hypothetical protein
VSDLNYYSNSGKKNALRQEILSQGVFVLRFFGASNTII